MLCTDEPVLLQLEEYSRISQESYKGPMLTLPTELNYWILDSLGRANFTCLGERATGQARCETGQEEEDKLIRTSICSMEILLV